MVKSIAVIKQSMKTRKNTLYIQYLPETFELRERLKLSSSLLASYSSFFVLLLLLEHVFKRTITDVQWMGRLKMRYMKMRHKEKCRVGKCRNGKYGTKLQGWKMRDWKMWHKNAGRENAGLENMAQEILGRKMREKSVWKANRCFIQHKMDHRLLAQ